MANIEDLLNDIDEVLKISSPKKPCRISNLKHESPKETSVPKSFSVSPEKKKNDLDTLLDDILGTEEVKYEKSKSPIFSESKNNFQSKGGKCLQTFLSNEEKICMKTFAFKGQTICDKLRCTNCDRKVIITPGFYFNKDCDYLFFRNYSMDLEQIKKKLIKDSNFSCYHCQCSWISLDKTIKISTQPQLKWVCGGSH